MTLAVRIGLVASLLGAGELASAQIQSPGARTLFARTFLVRSDWRIAEDERRVWENAIVYGLRPNWMVMGIVPWVSDGGSGIGDPLFLVQYDGLYSKNRPGGFTRLAGFAGVRPPWGSASVSSGTTSFVQGVLFTRASPRFFWNADAQWTARRGAGDAYRADASVMYRARRFPRRRDLFLVFEINAFFDRVRGRIRESVFVAPGVEWFLRGDLALEASIQVPVHRGDGARRDGSFLAGFRYVR